MVALDDGSSLYITSAAGVIGVTMLNLMAPIRAMLKVLRLKVNAEDSSDDTAEARGDS